MSFVEYNQKLSIFEEEAKLDPQISKFDQRQRQAIFSVVNGLHGKVLFKNCDFNFYKYFWICFSTGALCNLGPSRLVILIVFRKF